MCAYDASCGSWAGEAMLASVAPVLPEHAILAPVMERSAHNME